MLKSQQELNFSQYTELYEKLIPQNHLFRKINELIDFSFIRDELKDKYCPDNGRTAEDPEYLFKFLFLKCLHPMSDVDLVDVRVGRKSPFRVRQDIGLPSESRLITTLFMLSVRTNRGIPMYANV